jgi:hypothetical protein
MAKLLIVSCVGLAAGFHMTAPPLVGHRRAAICEPRSGLNLAACSTILLCLVLTARHARADRAPSAMMAPKSIEAAASACLEDGCSVDDVASLLQELKAESAALSKRNAQVGTPRCLRRGRCKRRAWVASAFCERCCACEERRPSPAFAMPPCRHAAGADGDRPAAGPLSGPRVQQGSYREGASPHT